MKVYHNEDKSDWGPGPWQTEPDKVVWVDETTGLDCMIHRNRVGSLCGYVGVTPTHPWFGKGYDEVDRDIEVHGGLTFAAPCDPQATENDGICHVPERDRPDDVWWFGFDCAHAWDRCPGMAASDRRLGLRLQEAGDHDTAKLFLGDVEMIRPNTSYKTIEYVRAEVGSLARQIVARATNSA